MPVTIERIRLVILTGEDVRDALKLLAAKKRIEMSEIADQILRAALTEEMAELAKPDDEQRPSRKGK